MRLLPLDGHELLQLFHLGQLLIDATVRPVLGDLHAHAGRLVVGSILLRLLHRLFEWTDASLGGRRPIKGRDRGNLQAGPGLHGFILNRLFGGSAHYILFL